MKCCVEIKQRLALRHLMCQVWLCRHWILTTRERQRERRGERGEGGGLTGSVSLFLEGLLDGLDLLTDGREHSLFQTVELIEAAPGPNLTETHKYPPHRLAGGGIERERERDREGDTGEEDREKKD